MLPAQSPPRPAEGEDRTLPGPAFEPFGPTTPTRQLVAAAVVMGGALPVALIASSTYGQPPRLSVVLTAIGAVATLGWLIDGRRYLGGGSAALAVGLAITISREAFVDEYALLFSFLGAALFLVNRIDPRAVSGSAGFLVYLAISAAGLHRASELPFPRAWIFAVIMLAWGGLQLPGILAGRDGAPAAVSSAP